MLGYVGEKKRVIASKCLLSRPQATFLFISWWVGSKRPRSFPKQENNTRKNMKPPTSPNFANEKNKLKFPFVSKTIPKQWRVWYGTWDSDTDPRDHLLFLPCLQLQQEARKENHPHSHQNKRGGRAWRVGSMGCRPQTRSAWLQGAVWTPGAWCSSFHSPQCWQRHVGELSPPYPVLAPHFHSHSLQVSSIILEFAWGRQMKKHNFLGQSP